MKKVLWTPNFLWAESRLIMHSATNTGQLLLKKKKKKKSSESLSKQRRMENKGEQWVRESHTG